ncbi:GNAT family N-acetyltransferase [Pseudomonas sp. NUPR-001]|uniref:GNAT family N-acetyltransferase n=1 Tax=Pseudomonas sp. NUPR-001 TaxID=3416058 RepID=UPI003F9D4112
MEDLFAMIESEQARQSDRLIQGVSLEQYFQKIESNAEFLVHRISGETAGFVAFYCNQPDAGVCFITMVLTAQEFRGKKVAGALLDGVISLARARGFSKCELEVRRDNYPAIALYSKHGFTFVDTDSDQRKMMFLL